MHLSFEKYCRDLEIEEIERLIYLTRKTWYPSVPPPGTSILLPAPIIVKRSNLQIEITTKQVLQSIKRRSEYLRERKKTKSSFPQLPEYKKIRIFFSNNKQKFK